jgi:periplasmic copper chaperone A
MKRTARVAVVVCGVAATAVVMSAGPAGAHVTPDKDEVAAGSYSSVTLTVPHGCEESPTRAIAIEIPEGLQSVTPMIHPGWEIEVSTEPLDEPIESEGGEEITERTSMVTFTAESGNELPDGFRDAFTLGFKAPDTAGEWLFFKTVQTCTEGETAWIEEYTGEGEEPEHPAPAMLLTDAETEEDAAAAEPAADGGETAAADTSDDDSDSSAGIAVAGLIFGLLGLATGGVALLKARKLTSPSS